jgi:YggT family protein
MGAIAAISAMLFDTVSSLQTFAAVFIYVYGLLLFAYVLLSWVKLPYSTAVNRVQRFLYDVCEPYLRVFRRLIPPVGGLDLSPIVAFVFLYIIEAVVQRLLGLLH